MVFLFALYIFSSLKLFTLVIVKNKDREEGTHNHATMRSISGTAERVCMLAGLHDAECSAADDEDRKHARTSTRQYF